MPQILIREKDYTRPGLSEYSNYSVVVPGFVSSKCNIEEVFDANGVCELSSQDEFKNKIGKVAPYTGFIKKPEKTEDTPINYKLINHLSINIKNFEESAKYILKIQPQLKGDGDSVDPNLSAITVEVDGNILTPEIKSDESSNTVYVFTNITSNKITINRTIDEALSGYSYYAVSLTYEGMSENDEELEHSEDWTYSNDDSTQESAEFGEIVEDICLGRIGYRDETAEPIERIIEAVPAHYGNQIAYELLGLGYPVLYVNMGVFDVGAQEEMRTAVERLGTTEFWEALSDKSTYDFRFVLTGFIYSDVESNKESNIMLEAASQIVSLAAFSADNNSNIPNISGRGDATALLDIDESLIEYFRNGNTTQTNTISAIQRAIRELQAKEPISGFGKYAAAFVPSVCYAGMTDAEYDGNNKFPASFHYLACFARSVQLGNPEWFAAAGMSRGTSNLTIDSAAYKLGEVAINALEPRCASDTCNISCNVIAKIRNNYYLWGNRTAHKLGAAESSEGDLVASHFLNIRQLCTTLKKQIYLACRRYTFDPNSDTLWVKFCSAIRPTLEQMKANQGIGDYQIVKVATNQKAKLKAKIRIIPIEAVEDFDIEIALEDNFGDVSTTILE